MSDQASAPNGEGRSEEAKAGWRNFRLLWFGQAVSEFGTAVTAVSLQLLAVLILRATPFQLGVLVFCEYVAYLVFALFVGVLVDKWDQWRIMLASYLGRAALIATIPLLAVTGWLRMWQLFVVATLIGLLALFFETASQAYIPSLVAADDLLQANVSTIKAKAWVNLVGPAAGGWIVQRVGAPWALVVDAISYLVGSACIAAIKPIREAEEREEDTGTLREQIAAGFHFVWQDRVMRRVLGFVVHTNFMAAGQTALVVLFLVHEVGTQPWLVGVLLTTAGVGAVVGMGRVKKLARKYGPGRVMGLAAVIGPILALLIPATNLWWGLAFFVVGVIARELGAMTFTAVALSYRQHKAPKNLQGRVSATTRLFTRGILPLGALLGGALGEWFNLRTAMLILGIGMATSVVWMVKNPAWHLTHADVGMKAP